MRNVRLMLVAAALFAAACGTHPSPRVVPQRPRPAAASLEERHRELRKTPLPSSVNDLGMAVPDHPSVRAAIALFTTKLRPGVQESLLRSAEYKPMIEAILEEYDLPKGLLYLPVIESAYRPTLTSRAGARGIWQFMAATAREYGLRVDYWVDERADPERSTRAAAAYLKDLHRQFRDWPLALAAYNAGATRVRRAMAATGSTTYWDLLEATAIPAETRGYVPSFFAAITLAADPDRYGLRAGEPIDRDVRYVQIEGPVSLRSVAEIANVDEATLVALNPAYHRRIVPAGRATVVVPAGAAKIVLARAAMLKDEDATFAELTEVPAMQREYEVKKGDTMYSIAKRFALTVDELRDLNGLPREHILHPGDRLRVAATRPVSAGGM